MGKVRTASTHWNVPGEYVPHGELFFMLMKKEPMVFSELVELGPVLQQKQSRHVPCSVCT